jgi:hypothetical protein
MSTCSCGLPIGMHEAGCDKYRSPDFEMESLQEEVSRRINTMSKSHLEVQENADRLIAYLQRMKDIAVGD